MRSEVEKLVEVQLGKDHLVTTKAKTALKNISKELNELKLKVAQLEMQKTELEKILKKEALATTKVKSKFGKKHKE